MTIRVLVLLSFLCLAAFSAAAQEQQPIINPGSGLPLEITADEALEWHRNDNTFIARTNAKAVQGDVSIAGASLTAHYRDGAQSDMEIWRVIADKNVTINSRENTATGDHAIYDVDAGTAILTGSDLKLTSPDQTVTAKEKFEYHIADGKLVATGKAKVTRPKPEGGVDTLEASQVSAIFGENGTGERVLKELEAVGNVVITTPEEVLTGEHGTYNAANNVANLSGNVKIRRGPNLLEGDKASVDLNTNVSTMLGGSAASGGRVRGIFYPGSEKKPEE